MKQISNKNLKFLIVIFSLALLFFNFSSPVQAQSYYFDHVILAQGAPSDPGSTGAPSDTDNIKLTDPLGGKSIPQIIGEAIKVALGIVGSIALVLFVYGGFVWMTAGGNPQKVGKGRDILIWASIGLAVIFMSYAILTFVLNAVTGKG